MCPCVLSFRSHLQVRTCGFWFSVLVLACRGMASSSIHVPAKDIMFFLWLHSIPWWLYTTFSLSSLSLMDPWIDSVVLVLEIVLKFTYSCMYLCDRMMCIHLGIYPVLRLLGQMEFLFLDPWGFSAPSSTMVELIYTPTNSVKVLFVHILSNICCLQIFWWSPF